VDCVLLDDDSKNPPSASAVDVQGARVEFQGLPGRRLVSASERLAARFGLLELTCSRPGAVRDVLLGAGYRDDHSGRLSRTFPRRRTKYLHRVTGLLHELGLPTDYGRRFRLPLQPEASRLQSIGRDIYDREQRLLPGAARAWAAMRDTAAQAGVELQVVSAFRSVDYQAGIVRRKRSSGQSAEEILHTSAAPGFSEHHTGRALDITMPGFDVLEEVFEDSPAFDWLAGHAASFGFVMSFPRRNPHGLAYEPWHWAWRPVSAVRR
jgi:D-alanyl-D-alanine carboxypeptidase